MIFANKDSLFPELLCAGCRDPWPPETAVACPHCDVAYCLPCTEDAFTKNPSACPSCSAPIGLAEFAQSKPSKVVRTMAMREVLVWCPNKPGACWSGTRDQLAAHVDVCPYKRASKAKLVDKCPVALACPACHQCLRDPMLTPCCDTAYCGDCLKFLCQVQTEEEKGCRICHAAISEDVLLAPKKSLLAILAQLKVHCPEECGWTGARGSLESDHFPACPKRQLPTTTPQGSGSAAAAARTDGSSKTNGAAASSNPPVGNDNVSLTTMNYHATLCRGGSDDFIAMAHIKAPTLAVEEEAKRKPLHVSAVMDVSGSMAGEKLQLAKEALEFVVGELSDRDKFGLVSFDDRVKERAEVSVMTADGKARAVESIREMRHGGSTNLSGGLFAGIRQARGKSFVPLGRRSPPQPQVSVLSRRRSDPTQGLRGSCSNSSFSSMSSADSFDSQQMQQQQQQTNAPPLLRRQSSRGHGSRAALFDFMRNSVEAPLVEDVQNVTTLHLPLVQAQAEVVTTPPSPTGQKKEEKKNADAPAVADTEEKYTRVVMIFTDGQANCGITEHKALVAETRRVLAEDPMKDVTVFTFGFGHSHNASLLQAIAETSQGMYYFVKEAAQMKEIFADCLGGLVSIVAENIRLTLCPAAGVSIGHVMSTFPTTTHSDGSVSLAIKDLYSEEARDIPVSFKVGATTPEENVDTATYRRPIARWTLRCDNVVRKVPEEVVETSKVLVMDGVFLGEPDHTVDEQLSRYKAAEAMKEANTLAEDGRVAEAHQCIRRVKQMVSCSTAAKSAYCQQLQEDLLQAEEATESKVSWTGKGQKRMCRMQNSHAHQRANDVEASESTTLYTNGMKGAMRKKAKSGKI